MIALLVNKFIWDQLKKDVVLNAEYDKYRTTFGANFIPFFPVFDNHAGDISWGSECYVLYDSINSLPTRNVFMEQREQILYTVIGPLPQLFEFKDNMIALTDHWNQTMFSKSGFRVNDINIWQSTGTRGRDKLRQTYSTSLIAEAYYFTC